ncbi:MAG: nicotinate-nicotinamide nucleotide adenylyltransferase [Planctomycetota bacterium]
MADPARRIALFGGAFDPPHLGHVLCATYAHAISGVDAVWILPVAQHPYDTKRDVRPWSIRWRLCQAAFAPLGFAELRDDERRNPDGKTYDLVRALDAAHPGTRWYLIGGSDTRDDLPNWHRGAELAQMIEVIPVPRAGFGADDAHSLPDISSTAIRERLARDEPVDGLVPAAVRSLIVREGWYRN